jgi:retron-type reverse transcriptase
MWKLLKAGYMEQWEYHKTFSGTPQGSGVSPLLANIYLSELDAFMESYKKLFDNGNSRQNLDYSKAASKLFYIRKRNRKNWEQWDEQEQKEALLIQKQARKSSSRIPQQAAMRHRIQTNSVLQVCR